MSDVEWDGIPVLKSWVF